MQLKNIIIKWLSRIVLKNNVIPTNTLHIYRKLERTALRLASARAHISFNETCINNNLLPNYTNIRLHDNAVRAQPFVKDFREELILNQITKQTNEIDELSTQLVE